MESLRDSPGAGADFEHTRPSRNEALEIEIVDVLVDCAQRVPIEALPFPFSQLIEVGCDGWAIVRHQVPERSTLLRRIPRPFQKSGGQLRSGLSPFGPKTSSAEPSCRLSYP